MTAQNQADTAACLFGAAETLRQRSNAVLWPANRLEYERSLAALHEALDDEALTTAWSSGRSLSTEQIVQLLSPEFSKDTAATHAR
jgi:hypothetical protein